MKRNTFSSRSLTFAFVVIAIALLTWKCTSPNQPGQFVEATLVQQIQPAFANLDVPQTQFEVEANAGGELQMPTGTVIHIPANAMVDRNGQPVSGRVSIEYREFHDAADIMLSGIPMKYDSAGTVYDFQTAGMMEIKANQNGKEVFLADGKEINIEMASFTEETNYNLYRLDPETKNWAYLGLPEVKENTDKQKGLTLLQEKGLPPQPTDIREVSADEIDGVFDFGVDYSSFPELKAYEGIKWEYAGEVGGKNDIESNEWAFNEVWTNVQLNEKPEAKGKYELTLSNFNTQFVMDVKPVVSGKNSRQVQKQLKRARVEYEAALAARTEEEKRLALQADVRRAFTLNSLNL